MHSSEISSDLCKQKRNPAEIKSCKIKKVTALSRVMLAKKKKRKEEKDFQRVEKSETEFPFVFN